MYWALVRGKVPGSNNRQHKRNKCFSNSYLSNKYIAWITINLAYEWQTSLETNFSTLGRNVSVEFYRIFSRKNDFVTSYGVNDGDDVDDMVQGRN